MGLVFAGWSDDQAAQVADRLLELASGVSLVADDRLAAGERSRQQCERDFALRAIGGDRGGRPWGAVGGAEQVQAQRERPKLRVCGLVLSCESVLEVGVEAGEAFVPAGHRAFPVALVVADREVEELTG